MTMPALFMRFLLRICGGVTWDGSSGVTSGDSEWKRASYAPGCAAGGFLECAALFLNVEGNRANVMESAVKPARSNLADSKPGRS